MIISTDIIELASKNDETMEIVCYAINEGVNGNKFSIDRGTLLRNYDSFIGKPVFIVPDDNNNPTTHAYDYKNKKFDASKRIVIGHIMDAYPVIVQKNDVVVHRHNVEDGTFAQLDGEMRIVTRLVIYKKYFPDVADKLGFLHYLDNLFFSMESETLQHNDNDIKVCTDINFTALTIVSNPAYKNAKSIEVSEEVTMPKSEKEVNLKDNAELETEVCNLQGTIATLEKRIAELETLLSSEKEANVSLTTKVSELSETIAPLNEVKERYDTMVKNQLGKDRYEKLSKLGEKSLSADELAEKTSEEFATLLVNAVDNINVDNFQGKHFEDHKRKNTDLEIVTNYLLKGEE